MAEQSSRVPSFDDLLTPFQIKGITLRNRFIMPGMQRGWCENGAPNAEMPEYYRKRVRGGIAMVISESCAIDHPTATTQPTACRLNAATVDAWARCIDAVKGAGGEMLLQLWHEGALSKAKEDLTLSPSGTAYPGQTHGRAASSFDLSELKDAYVRSSLLAQQAGATGVEVHCAHGFLLDQFLWPLTNLRGDAYGGPAIARRARFPAEIISAIREACGANFLISVRFSQWKEHDYDARIVDSPTELGELTSILRSAGADMLHASTRRFWIAEWSELGERTLAGWTRELSSLPTIAVGSVGLSKDVMESFFTEGEASTTIPASVAEMILRFSRREFDFIAIGRSLIGDPDWVNKVAAGDYQSVRPFTKADISSFEWEM